jgi:hypothetical protein
MQKPAKSYIPAEIKLLLSAISADYQSPMAEFILIRTMELCIASGLPIRKSKLDTTSFYLREKILERRSRCISHVR